MGGREGGRASQEEWQPHGIEEKAAGRARSHDPPAGLERAGAVWLGLQHAYDHVAQRRIAEIAASPSYEPAATQRLRPSEAALEFRLIARALGAAAAHDVQRVLEFLGSWHEQPHIDAPDPEGTLDGTARAVHEAASSSVFCEAVIEVVMRCPASSRRQREQLDRLIERTLESEVMHLRSAERQAAARRRLALLDGRSEVMMWSEVRRALSRSRFGRLANKLLSELEHVAPGKPNPIIIARAHALSGLALPAILFVRPEDPYPMSSEGTMPSGQASACQNGRAAASSRSVLARSSRELLVRVQRLIMEKELRPLRKHICEGLGEGLLEQQDQLAMHAGRSRGARPMIAATYASSITLSRLGGLLDKREVSLDGADSRSHLAGAVGQDGSREADVSPPGREEEAGELMALQRKMVELSAAAAGWVCVGGSLHLSRPETWAAPLATALACGACRLRAQMGERLASEREVRLHEEVLSRLVRSLSKPHSHRLVALRCLRVQMPIVLEMYAERTGSSQVLVARGALPNDLSTQSLSSIGGERANWPVKSLTALEAVFGSRRHGVEALKLELGKFEDCPLLLHKYGEILNLLAQIGSAAMSIHAQLMLERVIVRALAGDDVKRNSWGHDTVVALAIVREMLPPVAWATYSTGEPPRPPRAPIPTAELEGIARSVGAVLRYTGCDVRDDGGQHADPENDFSRVGIVKLQLLCGSLRCVERLLPFGLSAAPSTTELISIACERLCSIHRPLQEASLGLLPSIVGREPALFPMLLSSLSDVMAARSAAMPTSSERMKALKRVVQLLKPLVSWYGNAPADWSGRVGPRRLYAALARVQALGVVHLCDVCPCVRGAAVDLLSLTSPLVEACTRTVDEEANEQSGCPRLGMVCALFPDLDDTEGAAASRVGVRGLQTSELPHACGAIRLAPRRATSVFCLLQHSLPAIADAALGSAPAADPPASTSRSRTQQAAERLADAARRASLRDLVEAVGGPGRQPGPGEAQLWVNCVQAITTTLVDCSWSTDVLAVAWNWLLERCPLTGTPAPSGRSDKATRSVVPWGCAASAACAMAPLILAESERVDELCTTTRPKTEPGASSGTASSWNALLDIGRSSKQGLAVMGNVLIPKSPFLSKVCRDRLAERPADKSRDSIPATEKGVELLLRFLCHRLLSACDESRTAAIVALSKLKGPLALRHVLSELHARLLDVAATTEWSRDVSANRSSSLHVHMRTITQLFALLSSQQGWSANLMTCGARLGSFAAFLHAALEYLVCDSNLHAWSLHAIRRSVCEVLRHTSLSALRDLNGLLPHHAEEFSEERVTLQPSSVVRALARLLRSTTNREATEAILRERDRLLARAPDDRIARIELEAVVEDELRSQIHVVQRAILATIQTIVDEDQRMWQGTILDEVDASDAVTLSELLIHSASPAVAAEASATLVVLRRRFPPPLEKCLQMCYGREAKQPLPNQIQQFQSSIELETPSSSSQSNAHFLALAERVIEIVGHDAVACCRQHHQGRHAHQATWSDRASPIPDACLEDRQAACAILLALTKLPEADILVRAASLRVLRAFSYGTINALDDCGVKWLAESAQLQWSTRIAESRPGLAIAVVAQGLERAASAIPCEAVAVLAVLPPWIECGMRAAHEALTPRLYTAAGVRSSCSELSALLTDAQSLHMKRGDAHLARALDACWCALASDAFAVSVLMDDLVRRARAPFGEQLEACRAIVRVVSGVQPTLCARLLARKLVLEAGFRSGLDQRGANRKMPHPRKLMSVLTSPDVHSFSAPSEILSSDAPAANPRSAPVGPSEDGSSIGTRESTVVLIAALHPDALQALLVDGIDGAAHASPLFCSSPTRAPGLADQTASLFPDAEGGAAARPAPPPLADLLAEVLHCACISSTAAASQQVRCDAARLLSRLVAASKTLMVGESTLACSPFGGPTGADDPLKTVEEALMQGCSGALPMHKFDPYDERGSKDLVALVDSLMRTLSNQRCHSLIASWAQTAICHGTSNPTGPNPVMPHLSMVVYRALVPHLAPGAWHPHADILLHAACNHALSPSSETVHIASEAIRSVSTLIAQAQRRPGWPKAQLVSNAYWRVTLLLHSDAILLYKEAAGVLIQLMSGGLLDEDDVREHLDRMAPLYWRSGKFPGLVPLCLVGMSQRSTYALALELARRSVGRGDMHKQPMGASVHDHILTAGVALLPWLISGYEAQLRRNTRDGSACGCGAFTSGLLCELCTARRLSRGLTQCAQRGHEELLPLATAMHYYSNLEFSGAPDLCRSMRLALSCHWGATSHMSPGQLSPLVTHLVCSLGSMEPAHVVDNSTMILDLINDVRSPTPACSSTGDAFEAASLPRIRKYPCPNLWRSAMEVVKAAPDSFNGIAQVMEAFLAACVAGQLLSPTEPTTPPTDRVDSFEPRCWMLARPAAAPSNLLHSLDALAPPACSSGVLREMQATVGPCNTVSAMEIQNEGADDLPGVARGVSKKHGAAERERGRHVAGMDEKPDSIWIQPHTMERQMQASDEAMHDRMRSKALESAISEGEVAPFEGASESYASDSRDTGDTSGRSNLDGNAPDASSEGEEDEALSQPPCSELNQDEVVESGRYSSGDCGEELGEDGTTQIFHPLCVQARESVESEASSRDKDSDDLVYVETNNEIHVALSPTLWAKEAHRSQDDQEARRASLERVRKAVRRLSGLEDSYGISERKVQTWDISYTM